MYSNLHSEGIGDGSDVSRWLGSLIFMSPSS